MKESLFVDDMMESNLAPLIDRVMSANSGVPDPRTEMPLKLLRIINPLQPNLLRLFQQSFPGREDLERCLAKLGGDTLKPDKFPELVDRLWDFTQKDFHSEDIKKNLEAERGKLEDELKRPLRGEGNQ